MIHRIHPLLFAGHSSSHARSSNLIAWKIILHEINIRLLARSCLFWHVWGDRIVLFTSLIMFRQLRHRWKIFKINLSWSSYIYMILLTRLNPFYILTESVLYLYHKSVMGFLFPYIWWILHVWQKGLAVLEGHWTSLSQYIPKELYFIHVRTECHRARRPQR